MVSPTITSDSETTTIHMVDGTTLTYKTSELNKELDKIHVRVNFIVGISTITDSTGFETRRPTLSTETTCKEGVSEIIKQSAAVFSQRIETHLQSLHKELSFMYLFQDQDKSSKDCLQDWKDRVMSVVHSNDFFRDPIGFEFDFTGVALMVQTTEEFEAKEDRDTEISSKSGLYRGIWDRKRSDTEKSVSRRPLNDKS